MEENEREVAFCDITIGRKYRITDFYLHKEGEIAICTDSETFGSTKTFLFDGTREEVVVSAHKNQVIHEICGTTNCPNILSQIDQWIEHIHSIGEKYMDVSYNEAEANYLLENSDPNSEEAEKAVAAYLNAPFFPASVFNSVPYILNHKVDNVMAFGLLIYALDYCVKSKEDRYSTVDSFPIFPDQERLFDENTQTPFINVSVLRRATRALRYSIEWPALYEGDDRFTGILYDWSRTTGGDIYISSTMHDRMKTSNITDNRLLKLLEKNIRDIGQPKVSFTLCKQESGVFPGRIRVDDESLQAIKSYCIQNGCNADLLELPDTDDGLRAINSRDFTPILLDQEQDVHKIVQEWVTWDEVWKPTKTLMGVIRQMPERREKNGEIYYEGKIDCCGSTIWFHSDQIIDARLLEKMDSGEICGTVVFFEPAFNPTHREKYNVAGDWIRLPDMDIDLPEEWGKNEPITQSLLDNCYHIHKNKKFHPFQPWLQVYENLLSVSRCRGTISRDINNRTQFYVNTDSQRLGFRASQVWEKALYDVIISPYSANIVWGEIEVLCLSIKDPTSRARNIADCIILTGRGRKRLLDDNNCAYFRKRYQNVVDIKGNYLLTLRRDFVPVRIVNEVISKEDTLYGIIPGSIGWNQIRGGRIKRYNSFQKQGEIIPGGNTATSASDVIVIPYNRELVYDNSLGEQLDSGQIVIMRTVSYVYRINDEGKATAWHIVDNNNITDDDYKAAIDVYTHHLEDSLHSIQSDNTDSDTDHRDMEGDNLSETHEVVANCTNEVAHVFSGTICDLEIYRAKDSNGRNIFPRNVGIKIPDSELIHFTHAGEVRDLNHVTNNGYLKIRLTQNKGWDKGWADVSYRNELYFFSKNYRLGDNIPSKKWHLTEEDLEGHGLEPKVYFYLEIKENRYGFFDKVVPYRVTTDRGLLQTTPLPTNVECITTNMLENSAEEMEKMLSAPSPAETEIVPGNLVGSETTNTEKIGNLTINHPYILFKTEDINSSESWQKFKQQKNRNNLLAALKDDILRLGQTPEGFYSVQYLARMLCLVQVGEQNCSSDIECWRALMELPYSLAAQISDDDLKQPLAKRWGNATFTADQINKHEIESFFNFLLRQPDIAAYDQGEFNFVPFEDFSTINFSMLYRDKWRIFLGSKDRQDVKTEVETFYNRVSQWINDFQITDSAWEEKIRHFNYHPDSRWYDDEIFHKYMMPYEYDAFEEYTSLIQRWHNISEQTTTGSRKAQAAEIFNQASDIKDHLLKKPSILGLEILYPVIERHMKKAYDIFFESLIEDGPEIEDVQGPCVQISSDAAILVKIDISITQRSLNLYEADCNLVDTQSDFDIKLGDYCSRPFKVDDSNVDVITSDKSQTIGQFKINVQDRSKTNSIPDFKLNIIISGKYYVYDDPSKRFLKSDFSTKPREITIVPPSARGKMEDPWKNWDDEGYHDEKTVFGRDDEIHELKDRIWDEDNKVYRDGVVVIYGQRRIGKSVVALKLQNEMKKMKAIKPLIIVEKQDVLLPLSTLDYFDIDAIIKNLVGRVKSAVDIDIKNALDRDYPMLESDKEEKYHNYPTSRWEDLVKALSEEYQTIKHTDLPHIIVFIDEFTKLYGYIGKKGYETGIGSFLAIPENYHGVTFILVAIDHYVSMKQTFGHVSGHLRDVKITGLDRPIELPAAIKLIEQGTKTDKDIKIDKLITREYSEKLYQLTGGYPRLLSRLICKNLYNYLCEKKQYTIETDEQYEDFVKKITHLRYRDVALHIQPLVDDARFSNGSNDSVMKFHIRMNYIVLNNISKGNKKRKELVKLVDRAIVEEYGTEYSEDVNQLLGWIKTNCDKFPPEDMLISMKHHVKAPFSGEDIVQWLCDRDVMSFMDVPAEDDAIAKLEMPIYKEWYENDSSEFERQEQKQTVAVFDRSRYLRDN